MLLALSNLSIYYTWQNMKKVVQKQLKYSLKYQLRHEMKSLNYLMDYILYPKFKIT